ncbi:MAG: hypothetical protein ABI380_05905 [Edaphobacter sp.]
MKDFSEERQWHEANRTQARAALPDANMSARASMVNRTHRVVRERAKILAERRNRVRSLWIPLTICSALLLMICSAVWTVLDGYELIPIGVPDSSDQFLILFLWFFPVSMALLVMVWFRRTHKHSAGEAAQ